MGHNHDEGVAVENTFLDAFPKLVVGFDGVAIIEHVRVAEAAHELLQLGDVAVIRAAVADEGAAHWIAANLDWVSRSSAP